MTIEEKLNLIADAADDLKAENIEQLDVRLKTSIADYFVVCTGTSDRHVQSIAERVEEKMALKGVKPLRIEGERSAWILHDYGDIVLHIMREEQRQFYDLETLWKNTQTDPNLS